jgi:hypothetical protein
MLMSGIYPYYHEETYAIGLTLVESMCAMLLNSNPGEILAGFNGFDVAYIGVYKTALLVLLIIAPLFTVGITLSFFSEKFVRLIYRLRSEFRDTYLFSAINERTLCIAEDVAETDRKVVIAFALRISEEDVDAESLALIKKIGAYLINDDITQIKHSLRHTRNYYLLDTNDSENLEAGLRIYQRYNKERTDKVNMWLYTKNEISEVIFDHLYETFNVRLINEEGLIARTLATNYPVFDAVKDGRLSILIVGGGHIGLEKVYYGGTTQQWNQIEFYRLSMWEGDGNTPLHYAEFVWEWDGWEEELPTVSGTVSGGAKDATVSIVVNGEKQEVPVNEDGSFALSAVEGPFDVVIKTPGALSYTVKNVSAEGGDITLPEIEVVKGDTNGDDMINIMDMGAFRQNFGKVGANIANAFTDVNDDNMVNIMDMGTFRKNFGKTAAKDCTVVYGA